MIRNKLLLLISIALFNNTVMAYEAGNILIKVGAATVAPNDSSSQVVLHSVNAQLGEVSVDHDTQPGITATYMLTAHTGIELLAATPFDHNIEGASGAINSLDIGSTKHLPPTISVQYYPLDSGAKFQPYAGLGINYTVFFDSDTSDALNTTLGVANSSLNVDNSWGLSAQVGADYALTDKWFLGASIRYIDIDTEAKIKLSNGDQLNVDVDIDPWVSMVGIGYKF